MKKRFINAALFAATVGLAALALGTKAPQAEAACNTWTPTGTYAYCPNSSDPTGSSWAEGVYAYAYCSKNGSGCQSGQVWGCQGVGRRAGSGAAAAPFATYGNTASDVLASGNVQEHKVSCGCYWDVD